MMHWTARLCGLLLLCWSVSGQAQLAPMPVFDGAPAASWIAPADLDGDEFAVFHARKSFELAERPSKFVVHLSADNRYRFSVNGTFVSTGPQRSDLLHWRYETIDLAPYLRPGSNLLAAVVWNWGPHKPVAQFSHRTAFLLQGDTPSEAALVNTGRSWKVLHNDAYAPLPVSGRALGGYYAAPPGESLDGAAYPWGWDDEHYDDSHWPNASVRDVFPPEEARLRGTGLTGEAGGWQLTPRTVPQMEERLVRFAKVRRAFGIAAESGFLDAGDDLVIPAHERVSVLVDQEHLTNAYIVLELSGGRGSSIALTYAEALIDARGEKGNRNVVEGKTISGIRDEIRPDGGDARRYQSLWFRTYRYVQLDIETADQPLRLHDLHGVFTAYPFELKASFTSEESWLEEMWEINWRTARLCAGETYFDTPYWEQLQYLGDSRIQALISLYMSGDDRLIRQALTHFDRSRLPEGITASRYPSDLGQYIPTFSLIWVAMVHDFWMHRDDEAYVRRFLPGMRAVLGWFEERVDDTGMVGPIAWWPFVDWASDWTLGRPPGAVDGHSTIITLQFVYALQRAAQLEARLGSSGNAQRYIALADALTAAVRARTWNEEERLFNDSLEGTSISQQTNTMALLVDAVPAAEQAEFMQRVLRRTDITQSTYYFSYYLFEALRRAGLGEQYLAQLAPWRTMLDLGLTTTPEQPEPTRSDSHAWSAHPNYGLLATVLGIRPNEPGFRSVRIEPALGSLRIAEGQLPHEKGQIHVRLERRGTDGVRALIELPEGLSGTFVWRGREKSLRSGLQTIDL